ncbi:hydroxypyruvate isomerase [Luteitalea pratensis]|uniref:Hydroxypyruvate isomerase n=1 Tax=Luteitalea pratensis TaxID=1855912 RepID=A0A143PN27_LUTPR|nr:sugar phosphate isomerase/epimerase family protein [Luteitalea pratensis]AMY09881.1 hydroxypyruvate isomerase [Luteitalea pratensis]
MPPRISVFPKCYFDELCAGRMDYLQWLRDAKGLGGEGIEHYDGFLAPLGPDGAARVCEVMEETGQASSLLCFSPDFTHPDADERRRQVARQKAAIDMSVALGLRHCRTLSGQRLPGMTRAEGVQRTVEGIRASLEYAAERDVVLCMENHYKDGNWTYPEFAQAEDVFLEIVEQIDHPNFGVQYDPSNAIVGGYDPLAFLEKVRHRVVSMHASDRYLEEGATLEDLKQADGSTGYSAALKHGETGKGLNDYDTIFGILAEAGYDGWISIEDGMNGLDELARSAEFLKAKRAQYYGS